jgi:hypothetical protein
VNALENQLIQFDHQVKSQRQAKHMTHQHQSPLNQQDDDQQWIPEVFSRNKAHVQ